VLAIHGLNADPGDDLSNPDFLLHVKELQGTFAGLPFEITQNSLVKCMDRMISAEVEPDERRGRLFRSGRKINQNVHPWAVQRGRASGEL